MAETAATEAERLLTNAKQALRRARANAKAQKAGRVHDAAAGRRRGRLTRAVNDLTELLEATRQIAAQTRQRLAGQNPAGVHPARQPARSGCSPDRQGAPGQAGGVRP